MKIWKKVALLCALVGCMAPTLSVEKTTAESTVITTTPTGYASASEVVYQRGNLTVDKRQKSCYKNWGARGELSVFLTTPALSFYKGDSAYAALSQKKGGTGLENADESALYTALQRTMVQPYTYQSTGDKAYGETRYWYKYTDCVSNDDTLFSSFYSGVMHDSQWDSGNTWNREHTWPNSKGLGGQDENDIMMLRPTMKNENSTRGNKAYGEGSGYFDPGVSVRGDCARIVLFNYTRWGNTGYKDKQGVYHDMWGATGVIQSTAVLLRWMEEDPVDTWEMARNDVVESITGTRNVFIDYPEYAWLLFSEEIPDDMQTPSGIAKSALPPTVEEDSADKEDTSGDVQTSGDVLPTDSVGNSADSSDESSESSESSESVAPDGDSSNGNYEENGADSSLFFDDEREESTADGAPSSNGENSVADDGSVANSFLAGCMGSVGGATSGVFLAILGAGALRRRKRR